MSIESIKQILNQGQNFCPGQFQHCPGWKIFCPSRWTRHWMQKLDSSTLDKKSFVQADWWGTRQKFCPTSNNPFFAFNSHYFSAEGRKILRIWTEALKFWWYIRREKFEPKFEEKRPSQLLESPKWAILWHVQYYCSYVQSKRFSTKSLCLSLTWWHSYDMIHSITIMNVASDFRPKLASYSLSFPSDPWWSRFDEAVCHPGCWAEKVTRQIPSESPLLRFYFTNQPAMRQYLLPKWFPKWDKKSADLVFDGPFLEPILSYK